MSDRLDYPAFYELVTELVSSSATSTLFGRTDTNHSVIIGLDGGTIVCVRCGPKRGLAAIHALRSMQWGTFRVDDALVELSSPTLPPTGELVAALHPGATVFEDTPGDDSADPAQQSDNHSAEAKLLCDLLSRYVGPVAPVLCSEEIKAVGGLDHLGKLDLVLGKLAREIDDAGEASEFVLLAQRELAHRFAPPPSTGPADTVTPPSKALLDPTQAAKDLCGLVSDYLGPVAEILCQEKIAEVGGLNGRHELDSVIRHLAREIDEQREAEQFLSRARAHFAAAMT